jgi:hypothetical protein
MKLSIREKVFPDDFFKYSPKNPYRLSPISLNNDLIGSPKHQQNILFSSRLHKKIKAKDITVAANSIREGPETSRNKFSVSIGIKKNSHSSKILPPLKPTIHVSAYTPRKISPLRGNSMLTITFSSKNLTKDCIL